MRMKRFWIAVVVVFLVAFAYEFLVHGVILSNLYKPYTPGPLLGPSTPNLFLPPTGYGRAYPWLFHVAIFVAQFIFAFFFTYIFGRGVEGKGWLGEGFRYGVLVWGLAILPSNVGMYSWSQMPGKILMWWIIFGLIECVILGWVCACLYKKEPAVS
jgi:hypothetical protein